MSSKKGSTISDRESETDASRRGRPRVPRDELLAAADAALAAAHGPSTVTMDAIAVGAGVGKGTLFRAFGSRDGLLDALSEQKFASLRRAIESGEQPFGASTTTTERIAAVLDALLSFKLDNRHLVRARESSRPGVKIERNAWALDLIRRLIDELDPPLEDNDPDYLARLLLQASHIELVEELLASGMAAEDIRREQGAFVRRTLSRNFRRPGRQATSEEAAAPAGLPENQPVR